MPIRTTSDAVKGIIEVDDEIVLTPFIAVGSALVDDVVELAEDEDGNPYYDETADAARLELIERWLSAHFYTNRDPRTTSETAGTSDSYQSAVDLGLNSSHYGQTAMRLDKSGALLAIEASKNVPKKVGRVTWVGTEPGTVYP